MTDTKTLRARITDLEWEKQILIDALQQLCPDHPIAKAAIATCTSDLESVEEAIAEANRQEK